MSSSSWGILPHLGALSPLAVPRRHPQQQGLWRPNFRRSAWHLRGALLQFLPPPPLSSSSPTPPTLETGGVPSIAPSPTPFGVLVASSFGGVEDIGNDPCDGAKDPEGGATCASAGTVGDVGGSAAASVDSPQALATTWQRSVNHDRMILYYLLMTKEDWFRR
jgi:hypothetical protein